MIAHVTSSRPCSVFAPSRVVFTAPDTGVRRGPLRTVHCPLRWFEYVPSATRRTQSAVEPRQSRRTLSQNCVRFRTGFGPRPYNSRPRKHIYHLTSATAGRLQPTAGRLRRTAGDWPCVISRMGPCRDVVQQWRPLVCNRLSPSHGKYLGMEHVRKVNINVKIWGIGVTCLVFDYHSRH